MVDVKVGYLHRSKDPNRGYLENDPYIELANGKKMHGEHGLFDLRANVAVSAYEAGMLDNPIIREVLKK